MHEACDKEVVAPTKRRAKRKPLPADLPGIEVVKYAIEEESSLESSRYRSAPSRLFERYTAAETTSQRPLGRTSQLC